MRMKIACMFGSHNLFIDNGLKASISGMCVCMCVRAREYLCSFVRKHRVCHINNIGTVFAWILYVGCVHWFDENSFDYSRRGHKEKPFICCLISINLISANLSHWMVESMRNAWQWDHCIEYDRYDSK